MTAMWGRRAEDKDMLKRPDWMLWFFVALFTLTAIGWLSDYYHKVEEISATEAEHNLLMERMTFVEAQLEAREEARRMCRLHISCDIAEIVRELRESGYELPQFATEKICLEESAER